MLGSPGEPVLRVHAFPASSDLTAGPLLSFATGWCKISPAFSYWLFWCSLLSGPSDVLAFPTAFSYTDVDTMQTLCFGIGVDVLTSPTYILGFVKI